MDLKQLETFVCVAKTGSMTSAAKMLYLTPPTLARQIDLLEEEMGVKLFSRSTQGMTLTETGKICFEASQRILDMAAQMKQRCREAERGRRQVVRIGSLKGLVPDCYPGIKRAVRMRCPQIRLEHVEDTLENLRDQLLDGSLDFVEYYDAPLARYSQLQYIPLIWEGRNCLMTSSHRLAGKEKIELSDLMGERVNVYEFERVPGLREYIEAHMPGLTLIEGKKPGAALSKEGYSYYTVLDICNDGDICLIPTHCKNFFAPLVAPPLDIELTWSVGLIGRKELTPEARQVIEAAQALPEVFHRE